MAVGLGNPGEEYAHTPHSLGYDVVDALVARLGVSLRRSARLQAQLGRAPVGAEDVLLVKPSTFMNVSGSVVGGILRYYRISPADLVVVLDDADLGAGRLRIRARGGSGGHRGLKSIIDDVGSEDFARIRLGIGRDARGADLIHHVLDPFTKEERVLMARVVTTAAEAVLAIVGEGVDRAMNRFNVREEREEAADRPVGDAPSREE